jgi:hypothetical protein
VFRAESEELEAGVYFTDGEINSVDVGRSCGTSAKGENGKEAFQELEGSRASWRDKTDESVELDDAFDSLIEV